MTTDQINSGADRTGDAVTPPNQASDKSAESKKKKKKKKKRNNNSNNKSNCMIHQGQIKDGVMKGVVILSGTSAHMTTDFRLFNAALVAHSASKGYKKWPGVLENLKPLKADTWNIIGPDKTKCATIMTT